MGNVPADRPGLFRTARFLRNDIGHYRLKLTREWGITQRTAVVIGLNPSIADNLTDDPTIKALYQFCDQWNCERLIMLNLFTLIATEPKDMIKHPAPECGGSLEPWIETFTQPESVYNGATNRDYEPKVVAAWGAHGVLRDQDRKAMAWLNYWNVKAWCLGTNKNGTPLHPLYQKRDVPLIRYYGR